jgi:large subunit ribosomal protein L25
VIIMSEVKLATETRTEFGKGAARRIRRDNKVPGVLYGHGTDPVHLIFPGHELLLALRTPNVLIALEVDGKTALAIPKSVQRDPLKGFLEHVLNALPVEAEATHIPESVTVSIAGLSAGDAILAKNIELPKGTTLAVEDDAVVLQVLAAQAEESAGEESEGDEAAAEA